MDAASPGPELAAILAAVLACGGTPDPDPAQAGPAPLEELRGTAWKAEEIAGQPVRGEHPPVLYFDSASAVSGFAGCNQFSGPVSGGSAGLRFGPLAATRRACEPPRMELEARFLRALSREPLRLERGAGSLSLVDADGAPVLRLLEHVLPDDAGPS